MLLAAHPAAAKTLRLATWNIGLERAGPGLLLRDILRGDDPQIASATRVLQVLDADILLLTGIDHDHDLHALRGFADHLAGAGLVYPHLSASNPNTGVPTGIDVDGNGRTNDPRDAQGWGRFPGAGGMAILSRYPIAPPATRDFSAMLWRDLPGALLPPDMAPTLAAVQRLSTTAHWDVAVEIDQDHRLHLLTWHATPPVFDGPEDRNGRRNHDEAAFWLRLLDGDLPQPPPPNPFVILGDANLDPSDGDGRPDALRALLAHPAVQDPAPRGTAQRADPTHSGDPAQDTALYPAPLGGLRLDYILPSRDLRVTDAGVLWPAQTDPLWPDLAAASRHFPVWVEIDLP